MVMSRRLTDRAHTLPYCLKEGGTRVLHQMPTVGNLDHFRARTRDGMTVARAAPIAGDDADTGVACQARLYARIVESAFNLGASALAEAVRHPELKAI